MIAGLVLAAFGAGLIVLLKLMEPHEEVWSSGLLFLMIGVALLASARVVRPGDEELTNRGQIRNTAETDRIAAR